MAKRTQLKDKIDALESQLASRAYEAYERHLMEQLSYFDNMVDPLTPYRGENGEMWLPLGAAGLHNELCGVPYRTEEEHRQMRLVGRWLHDWNPFALNGHENRVSYVYGSGHTYTVVEREGKQAKPEAIEAAQRLIDDWCYENVWGERQQEIRLRRDRDGECFLRWFEPTGDSLPTIRFVEPGQVVSPQHQQPNVLFGIETQPGDAETAVNFWITEEPDRPPQPVEASQIQHRKENVDMTVRRGVPTMWPVRTHLQEALNILRAGSRAIAIQISIAMIRKHGVGAKGVPSSANVQRFRDAKAAETARDPVTGETRNYQRFGIGSILDVRGDTEYDFPGMGLRPDRYTPALQAELRAIASRLVMPEFMLTSDASNANYASTLVAEGPAVKMFERLQRKEIEADLRILWRLLEWGARVSKLSDEDLETIDIVVTPPMVATRNRLEDAQVSQILNGMGVESPQSTSGKFGLKYGQEQANIQSHAEEFGGGMVGAATDDELGDDTLTGETGDDGPTVNGPVTSVKPKQGGDGEPVADTSDAAQVQSKMLGAAGGIKGMIELLKQRDEGLLNDESLVTVLVLFYQIDREAAQALVAGLPDPKGPPEPEPVPPALKQQAASPKPPAPGDVATVEDEPDDDDEDATNATA